MAGAAGFLSVSQQVPVDRSSLSVTTAQQRLREVQDALAAAAPPRSPVGQGGDDRLAKAVARAETIESGLRGPVLPVAVAGGLLALVLVAAAGSFWADRRGHPGRAGGPPGG